MNFDIISLYRSIIIKIQASQVKIYLVIVSSRLIRASEDYLRKFPKGHFLYEGHFTSS